MKAAFEAVIKNRLLRSNSPPLTFNKQIWTDSLTLEAYSIKISLLWLIKSRIKLSRDHLECAFDNIGDHQSATIGKSTYITSLTLWIEVMALFQSLGFQNRLMSASSVHRHWTLLAHFKLEVALLSNDNSALRGCLSAFASIHKLRCNIFSEESPSSDTAF
jgi:hypothetical protein